MTAGQSPKVEHPGAEIRLVTERDFAEWLHMRLALWPAHTDEEMLAEMRQLYEAMDSTPVFVAADPGGKLLGFAEFSMRETVEWCSTRNVGYVEGWYVKPEFRRSGIGAALIAMGVEWAVGKGCTEMASDTTPEYPASPAAHKAAGFVEAGDPFHFRKSISSRHFP